MNLQIMLYATLLLAWPRLACCCALLVGLCAVCCSADDKAAADHPLAGLPGKAGQHVEKIENLSDDSWLELGEPKADPRWGPAYGRGYYSRLAAAPGLGGAFYYGEGEHGYWNKKTRRYGDDLWFYDLRGHRWICCYPGTHVDKVAMKLNDLGWEVTEQGEPVPIAPLVHGYELSTFVPHLNKFMFLPRPGSYWKNGPLLARRKAWENPKGEHVHTGEPRYWNVATGKWERERVRGDPVRADVCYALIHLRGRKTTLLYNRRKGIWLYDHATRTWKDAQPAGSPPPVKNYEGVSCYDAKRGRAYFFNRYQATAPFVYDVEDNRWITPDNKNLPKLKLKYEAEPDARLNPSTQFATATYDDVNNVILYCQHRVSHNSDSNKDYTRRAWYIYDPAKTRWSEPTPFPEGFLEPYQRINAFYDRKLNVHVLLRGHSDTRTDTKVWVYRYGR